MVFRILLEPVFGSETRFFINSSFCELLLFLLERMCIIFCSFLTDLPFFICPRI